MHCCTLLHYTCSVAPSYKSLLPHHTMPCCIMIQWSVLHNHTMHCCAIIQCSATSSFNSLLHHLTMLCCTNYKSLLHLHKMYCCIITQFIVASPHCCVPTHIIQWLAVMLFIAIFCSILHWFVTTTYNAPMHMYCKTYHYKNNTVMTLQHTVLWRVKNEIVPSHAICFF